MVVIELNYDYIGCERLSKPPQSRNRRSLVLKGFEIMRCNFRGCQSQVTSPIVSVYTVKRHVTELNKI